MQKFCDIQIYQIVSWEGEVWGTFASKLCIEFTARAIVIRQSLNIKKGKLRIALPFFFVMKGG